MAPALAAAAESRCRRAAAEAGHGRRRASTGQAWTAGNEVSNTASLQRGAANFVNYCLGCHSLKYLRYSRMAKDLDIPDGAAAPPT